MSLRKVFSHDGFIGSTLAFIGAAGAAAYAIEDGRKPNAKHLNKLGMDASSKAFDKLR